MHQQIRAVTLRNTQLESHCDTQSPTSQVAPKVILSFQVSRNSNDKSVHHQGTQRRFQSTVVHSQEMMHPLDGDNRCLKQNSQLVLIEFPRPWQ